MALYTPTTMISGTQSVGSNNTNQRKYDIDERMWYDRPSVTPLLSLARGGKTKLRMRKVTDVEYRHFEKKEHAVWSQVNYGTGYSSVATSIVLDSVDHIRVGTLLKNVSTGDVARVTTYNESTSTVTVTRGFGATTATTWADNAYILDLGLLVKEGSTTPEIKQPKAEMTSNYIATIRTPHGGTRDHIKTVYYAEPNPLLEMRKQAFMKHKKEIELMLHFGEPVETTINSNTYRSTGGLYYWINQDSNSKTAISTTLTVDEFMTVVRKVWEYNTDTDTLYMLASPLIVQAIEKWKDNNLQMEPDDTAYNLTCTSWQTAWGKIKIITDWMMAAPKGATNAYDAYGDSAFIINPEYITYAWFDRDTYLWTNTQDNNYDGQVDEYISKFGLIVHNTVRHHLITGVQAFASS